MVTTMHVSKNLIDTLKNKKMYDNESYEDIIWGLLEDSMELSEETKKDIAKAEEEFKKGKIHTLSEVKKELEIIG